MALAVTASQDIWSFTVHVLLKPGLENFEHYFTSVWDECNCVQIWELDHRKGWALKNWCFQTVVLEKMLESPLNSKEIKPVNPKGNQPWMFIGRTDSEAKTPIFWPPDVKNSLEKTLMLGKVEGRRRRGWQRMRWLDGIIDSVDMNLRRFKFKLWKIVKDRGVWHAAVHGVR